MLCSIIWQVLQLEYSLTCFKSYFNKWKKLSIGIDFGIGIDQNSWYRYRYRPKKLVSPITSMFTVRKVTEFWKILSTSSIIQFCDAFRENIPGTIAY